MATDQQAEYIPTAVEAQFGSTYAFIYRSCQEKRRYDNFGSAYQAFRSLLDEKQKRGDSSGRWLHVYSCWFCDAFHIGHHFSTLSNQSAQIAVEVTVLDSQYVQQEKLRCATCKSKNPVVTIKEEHGRSEWIESRHCEKCARALLSNALYELKVQDSVVE